MCEFRLGINKENKEVLGTSCTVSEIQACMKKIKSSLNYWIKSGGRQGYLDFVKQFVG